MSGDRPTIASRVGMAGWGDNKFRGRWVGEQLLGRTRLSELLCLAIGLTLAPEEAEFVDELAVAVTLADPHIWPIKLTRVVGAFGGSPIPGFAAGLLATDGIGLGPGSVRPAAAWICDLAAIGDARHAGREARRMLEGGQRLPGFGVPARRVDERVTMLSRRVQIRGRTDLAHWSVWRSVVEEARSRQLEPNIASAFAAAVLDLGVPAPDVVVVAHISAMACFLSNAVEGAKEPATVLRSVPAEFLRYRGPARRPSPRSRS